MLNKLLKLASIMAITTITITLSIPASAGGGMFDSEGRKFSGCYYGGGLGLETGTLKAKDYGYSFSNGATTATAEAGCDTRIGSRAFLGLFGSYTFGSGSGEAFGYDIGIKGRWDAGARLGYLIEESTAVFIKAGVAQIDIKNAKKFKSYTLGGGIETYPFRSLPNTSFSLEASAFMTETDELYGTPVGFESIEGGFRIRHRFLTY